LHAYTKEASLTTDASIRTDTTMMTMANEGEGNNTTTNNGSLLYSSFSLRPPLPPGSNDGVISASNNNNNNNKNDDDIQIRHKRQKIISKKQQQQQDYCAVKSSFIFRMYVACHILQVKTETRFTAIVLLHRYAQSKNNNKNNNKGGNNNKNEVGDNNNNEYNNDDDNDNDNDKWPWIGAVCLFLACKTEEEPRRLRDVINMARMVLSSSSSSSKDIDNVNNNSKKILCMNLLTPPSLNEEAYWDSKRKAIETESIVLRWLGFDCSVSHPHRAVYWILEKEIEVWQQLLLLSKSESIQTQKTIKEVTTTQTSSLLMDEKDIRLTLPIPAGKQNYDNAAADNNNHGTGNFNDSNDDDSFNNNDNNNDNNNGSTVNIIRDKLLSFSFRRLNDALFYPIALQWGIVEMACAALDLAVHRLEEVENDNTDDEDGTSNDMTTSLIHDNKNSSIKNNGSISNKSFFKKEWWKRYGVSNEIFDGCRNSLKEATSNLENLSTAATTSTASAATT
jgi:hypothetical protein